MYLSVQTLSLSIDSMSRRTVSIVSVACWMVPTTFLPIYLLLDCVADLRFTSCALRAQVLLNGNALSQRQWTHTNSVGK